jgi:hypothetical protein
VHAKPVRCGIGREASTQSGQVGQLARCEIGGKKRRELGLASALMRQRQQVDHQTAC